jgi:hypothetical protein
MATNSKTKSVSALNKQLAGVASKAKSLGINTGKADAMVAQTTAQGSKSFKGSSYEKDYQASAIAADGLAPTAPINLPEKPTVPDVGNLVAPGNIGLQSTAEGMYTVDPATGMTTMAAPTDPLAQNQQGRLADMFAAYEGMGSGEADLAKLEKENKLAQKRQAVSNYTGQLNAIVAKSQAEQLGLEGQGRGITESIIGGQQAQINREAAIQALPVQAQLAAAQGDLEMAQQHVDKLFAIKRQDAQALFQFKSNVINSVYDFADKQEQRRLDEVSKIETRKYEEQQDFLKAQRSLLSSALQQGAPSSVVNAINGATTQEEALIAAGEYTGDLLEREAKRANIAQSYASIEASQSAAAVNRAQLAAETAKQEQIKQAIESGQVVLNKEQQDIAYKLGKDFESSSKEFMSRVQSMNTINAAAQEASAAGDLALIFSYMKMLDPGSAVREQEFANAQNAAGVPERIRAAYNNTLRGERLTDTTRTDFVDRASSIYDSSLKQQIQLEHDYRDRAISVFGLPENAADLVIKDVRATSVGASQSGLPENDGSDDPLGLFRTTQNASKFDKFTQGLISSSFPY